MNIHNLLNTWVTFLAGHILTNIKILSYQKRSTTHWPLTHSTKGLYQPGTAKTSESPNTLIYPVTWVSDSFESLFLQIHRLVPK